MQIKHIFIGGCFITAVLFIGALLWLRHHQNKFLFIPTKRPNGNYETTPATYNNPFQTISISDTLDVWFLPHMIPAPRKNTKNTKNEIDKKEEKKRKKSIPTLIVCHGNGGGLDLLVEYFIYLKQSLWPCHLICFTYSGYGTNILDDHPSISSFKKDASDLCRWIGKRNKIEMTTQNDTYCSASINYDAIYLLGHSMGGAFVLHAASLHPELFAGVVIENTFTCLKDAASHHLPLPSFMIRWMLKEDWSSAEICSSISIPLLIVHGEDDTIIPGSHSKQLHECATIKNNQNRIRMKECKLITVKNKGHNDTFMSTMYMEELSAFIHRSLYDK